MSNQDQQEADELPLEQALAAAIHLHQQQQLEQAEAIYRAILEQFPAHPETLHFFGLLRYQQGHGEQAIALIEQALVIVPDYTDAHNNLGNIYRVLGNNRFAAEHYRRTLALNPEHISACNNLGILLRELAEFEEAIVVLNKAISLMPNNPDLYRNLGNAHKSRGDFSAAVAAYRRALDLRSYDPEDYENLAVALYMQGDYDQALPLVKQWLEHDPDNPLALHRLAAFGGQALDKASDAYISQTFDSFASTFDYVLKNLDYQAPFLVAEAVEKHYGQPAGNLNILDAGCGTGLCGPLLKDFAASLVGIDLSVKMLERAAKRGCYHALQHAELVSWIAAQTSAHDVIISADTLVYFGDLREVSQAVAGALRPGGYFIFTLESCDEHLAAGYKINPHGRFSHRRDYIEQVLTVAGLRLAEITPVVLRNEGAQTVDGYLIVASLPAA